MIEISIIVVIIYLFYSLILTMYYKYFKRDVIKDLGDTNSIALTFDDGIDSVYTNRLLDLLSRYNIKATFFVVANSVIENSDILKRMVSEGHTIGLHSLDHKSALLKGYIYTKRDFETSLKIMKENDLNIKYYRPPWGHVNLFTLRYVYKYNLRLILWNVMVGDWKKFFTAEDIERRLLKEIDRGDIICLHDGRGRDEAPKRTIEALERVIPMLIDRGYKFTKIEAVYG
ncbi:polysaccharide deacetylase family protein [Tissierellaceae bacterium HCP3S3_D8]